jgi:hypothetical protein
MTQDNTSLIDNLAKMKQSWALVFGDLPPVEDSVLYRWLCLFPMRNIELAFQKTQTMQRKRHLPLTPSQVRNRIQDTLYWMKNDKKGTL